MSEKDNRFEMSGNLMAAVLSARECNVSFAEFLEAAARAWDAEAECAEECGAVSGFDEAKRAYARDRG